MKQKPDSWPFRVELHFAPGGAEALELMAATPMNVVVSDMRMPGMDGVQLLEKVKRLYPETARVALSGHMDEGMILASTKVAHQYLAKPCNADMLVSVIRRILALRRYLAEEFLRCLASAMEHIPSLPELYLVFIRKRFFFPFGCVSLHNYSSTYRNTLPHNCLTSLPKEKIARCRIENCWFQHPETKEFPDGN